MNYNNLPCMEVCKAMSKLDYKTDKYIWTKPKVTGICGFCGKNTSKKNKLICIECSVERIKKKYSNKKNDKIK